MENNKDIEGFEKCFCCRKSLHDGVGRFRKVDRVFCIKCYKEETLSLKYSEVEEGAKRIHFLSGNSTGNIFDSCN